MDADRRPDVPRELERLKDFQRATVDHVHQRLWLDDDAGHRFLVADEVGLGKTLVARGVIARTIDYLWDKEARIDVIYICSNGQIARQNLRRLNIGGYSVDHADRLTLLPTVMTDLRRNRVNFISFTPGTSFQINESGGKAEERVLLQWLLAKARGTDVVRSRGWLKFFRGATHLDRYERAVRSYSHQAIDLDLAQRFGEDVDRAAAYTGRPLNDELDESVDRFRYLRDKPSSDLSRHRYRLVGQLRSLVARAAVESLEPDLVILDEFQRFKDLLSPGTPSADLAHAIFAQPQTRVLLLSATPYKMYTLPDEPEGDDHYQDFVRTVHFLGGHQMSEEVARELSTMRQAMLGTGDRIVGQRAKAQAELLLRRVMSRTERLSVSADRDGMLQESALEGATLESSDVTAYASAERIARCVDRADIFEYWRSSPYVFNIMEGYQVKRRLRESIEESSEELTQVLRSASGMIKWEAIRNYEPLDPGNPKMRGLVKDTMDRGMWQVLWLPPSLPYYSPTGAYADPAIQQFTKRLVFSSWAVVPKAIAFVLSYEAERRASEGRRAQRSYDSARQTALLRFQLERGRLTGMPVLALVYPATVLARLGDPLDHARRTATELPANRGEVEKSVQEGVAAALKLLPAGPADGPEDQRWYWAAPFLLDAHELGRAQEDLVDRMLAWGNGDSEDGQTRLVDHIREARDVDPRSLGRRPDDLTEVLALLALAGPGTTSLRALSRVCGGPVQLGDVEQRESAAYVSWGLPTLFNRPESMALLRTADDAGDAYWRTVLAHCFDGNLQAVLDEYVHVLVESEGLQDADSIDRGLRISEVAVDALMLRATRAAIDEIRANGRRTTISTHNGRVHFAARFGRSQSDEANVVQREGQVRVAYNSPFWPFVLASTSIGQEGLDFHVYSHAVVHWNLPANPVDLEQREGRVHRYKGHAIRKNVARNFASAAFHATVDDPWYAMFLAAVEQRTSHDDLCPFWMYAPEGGVRIERYVPSMPLSKESSRYQRLLRTVGAYRMVMGQPRQEDLLRYLGQADDLAWARIDLAPPVVGPPGEH